MLEAQISTQISREPAACLRLGRTRLLTRLTVPWCGLADLIMNFNEIDRLLVGMPYAWMTERQASAA